MATHITDKFKQIIPLVRNYKYMNFHFAVVVGRGINPWGEQANAILVLFPSFLASDYDSNYLACLFLVCKWKTFTAGNRSISNAWYTINSEIAVDNCLC